MSVRLTNAAGDKPTLWVYGTIGDDFGGITADELRQALNQIPRSQQFEMRIFSDGGSFDEAMAMHALIAQRGAKSHGIVDGLAASAASLLLQATGRRSMSEHSRQMIHEVHGRVGASLRANEFRALADQMDATNRELMAIYSKNWKGTQSDLEEALSQDTWLNAAESVTLGLADDVVGQATLKARVNTDLFAYHNVPDDVSLVSGPMTLPWLANMEDKLNQCLRMS